MGIAGKVRPCRRSRSGSPHAPWKAGGRSGTERALLLYILTKNWMVLACFQTAHPLSSTQSAVQRRPPDSYGNSGQGETLQATPKRLTARPMESGRSQRNETGSSPPHTHKNTGWQFPAPNQHTPTHTHRVQRNETPPYHKRNEKDKQL